VKVRWLVSGCLSVFLLGIPARAATIANWHFDRDRQQLDFTTDEDVQPKVQLVSNPTRLVIDLPGIVLGHPHTSQSVGGAIQEIRLGQVDPYTTRLVIALAPGYTLDPAQVKVQGDSPTHWHVQLPAPQPLSTTTILRPDQDNQEISVALPRIAPAFPPGTLFAGVVSLTAPMTDLQAQVRALMTQYSFLHTGMFFLDLQTGNYLNIGGDRVFPAASTIKLPILIAFFQDLDAGKVRLDEPLVMRDDLITDGSGEMQDEPVGTRFTAAETVTKMITISDNTATNMIIDRLGGIDQLNQRFQSWGLQDTVIHHMLSDLRGTNTTSSQDMVRLLALVVNDKLLSAQSKDQVLNILRHTTIRSLLPAGLGAGADIANKTGDIGFLIGDAGLITMPTGKRYLAGIFVERPYDDTRGRDFIQQVSRLVYNYLDQPNPVSSANSP
jgi:beta-lactamase class A